MNKRKQRDKKDTEIQPQIDRTRT